MPRAMLALVLVAAAAGVGWTGSLLSLYRRAGTPGYLLAGQIPVSGSPRAATDRPPALLAPPRAEVVAASAPTAATSVAGHPAGQVVAPVARPVGAGSFSFEIINHDGTPARWNPCAAVHYVVNLTGAPAGAGADVQQAVAIVSQSSGLRFVYDGTSVAAPGSAWIRSGPVGASGWPAVLIGWTTPGHTDLGLKAAMGGITRYEAAAPSGGDDALVTAVVALNANDSPGPGFGPNARGALLLHELAHVVGLGHVDDRTQLMNPVSTGAPGAYGAGDLTGLARLGAGACLIVPPRSHTQLG